jgi:hypothetical protein
MHYYSTICVKVVNDAVPFHGNHVAQSSDLDEKELAAQKMDRMTLSEEKSYQDSTKGKDNTDREDRDSAKSENNISEMRPRREENAGRFFDSDESEQVRLCQYNFGGGWKALTK